MGKTLINKLKNIFIIGFFIFVIGYFHNIYAQSINAFVVEVQPSSFDVNTSVDLVVRAVNNGDIVKSYKGDIFIEVEGNPNVDVDYTVPSDGIYTFTAQDQGIKTFSKGLQFKKNGTFKIIVSDLGDEGIRGETTVIVGTETNNKLGQIQVISPISGSVEKKSDVNVFGSSSEFPNSPIQYYINGNLVQQGLTDTVGNFNTYLTGLDVGQNKIIVKIVNSENTILAESSGLNFSYQPITDDIFKGININPSGSIKQGEQILFDVKTNDLVSSVKLLFSDNSSYPMDKSVGGGFTKTLTVDNVGEITVSIEIVIAGTTKNYDEIYKFNVTEGTIIKNIKFFTDLIEKNTITLKWEVSGKVPSKYKVEYGISENLLNQSVSIDSNEIFIEDIDPDSIYYFKITPIGINGEAVGNPSEIVNFKTIKGPTCIVKNINVYEEQIGDKYYLVRSGVENVDKYIIYRSEFETSDSSIMNKVGETKDTRFEYPFNRFSKTNEYAFYLVEAVCQDGTSLKIDDVKKVQVGPIENMLLIMIFSAFVYASYKLYKYSV